MPRIVRFHQTGEPEVMRIEDLPSREPGQGEVRIRVRAIGLNRAEAMFRRGQYLEEPVLPAGYTKIAPGPASSSAARRNTEARSSQGQRDQSFHALPAASIASRTCSAPPWWTCGGCATRRWPR